MSTVDPVLRCDSCSSLTLLTSLHKLGACHKCGNRRIRNLTVFNEEERQQLLDWGFADLVAEFEGVEDA